MDVACSNSFVPGQPFNFDLGFFWHGSHVAGIVAAADNGVGTLGVAPGATIMGVKALHGGSGAFSWVIQAILFASDPGSFPGYSGCQRADIINMSLAGAWFKRFGQGFHSAINISATAPEDWCLGNLNFTKPASYSNYGNGFIWLAGPGGDFDGSSTLCTIPRLPPSSGSVTFPAWIFDGVVAPCGGSPGGNFYCWAVGTSMATPAAAGVAALIVDKYPGSHWAP